MTRNWSCYRLLGTPPPSAETLNPLLAEALPKLVGYMQTADAGSRWFFQRHDDTGSVELAFHSTAPVRRELERLLLAESDRHGWPVLPEDPASCPAACPPAPTLAEQSPTPAPSSSVTCGASTSWPSPRWSWPRCT